MNVLEVTIGSGSQASVFVEGQAIAEVPQDLLESVRRAEAGGGVDIGVRPRDLMLGGPEDVGLPGMVWVREGHGEVALLAVHTADNQLRVEAAPDTAATDGDSITLRPREDSMHFFERRTGRTIGRRSPGSAMDG